MFCAAHHVALADLAEAGRQPRAQRAGAAVLLWAGEGAKNAGPPKAFD